jgi:hypothetical protein
VNAEVAQWWLGSHVRLAKRFYGGGCGDDLKNRTSQADFSGNCSCSGSEVAAMCRRAVAVGKLWELNRMTLQFCRSCCLEFAINE